MVHGSGYDFCGGEHANEIADRRPGADVRWTGELELGM